MAGDVNKSVNISFNASTQNLEKNLKKIPNITDAQASKAAKELGKNFDKMDKSAAKTSKSISAKMKKLGKSFAAVGAAVAATGAAAVAFGQQMADLTNELVDASTKSGIAVDTLAGLRLAAEGSGLAFANLEGGLIKFQSAMDSANMGSKLTADAFKSLGVDVADADGNLRDADTVFNEAVRSLGQLENTTERNAKAMILFGRSGGASLIQSGALDNLEAMKNLATEFGISVEQDAVASMATFQRKMAEFGTVGVGTLQSVFDAVAGKNSLNMGIEFATKSVIFLGSVTKDVLGVVGQSFENIFILGQAAYLAMTGEVDRAQVLLRDNARELDTAYTNLGSTFTRASDEVARFEELSAASTAPAKMTQTADATRTAADEMNKLNEAAKKVQENINSVTEAVSDVILQNVELEEQVADRLTPEYEKQVQQIQELGQAISAQINSIEREADVLLDAANARELSVQETEQLYLLLEEQGRLEATAAENRLQERKELAALDAEVQKKKLEDIDKRAKAEKDAQDDIIRSQQDAINRVADVGSNFVNVITALSDLMSVAHEHQIEQFRTRADDEQAAIDKMVKDGVISAQQAAEHKASIEKGYQQQVQELKMKEFKLGQTAALADIAFSTAKAVAQALALPPVARGATIAAVLAASGLQTAAVMAQSPPKFDVGGMVGSNDSAPDVVQANLLSGEAVLDRSTVSALGGAEGVRRLQFGGIHPSGAPIIIQPFKHFDRYTRAVARMTPRRVGSGAY
jgi:ribosomal protein S20